MMISQLLTRFYKQDNILTDKRQRSRSAKANTFFTLPSYMITYPITSTINLPSPNSSYLALTSSIPTPLSPSLLITTLSHSTEETSPTEQALKKQKRAAYSKNWSTYNSHHTCYSVLIYKNIHRTYP